MVWKDTAKGFSNQLSKVPLHISKWVEIAFKDTTNFKKVMGSQVLRLSLPSSTSEAAKQKAWGPTCGIPTRTTSYRQVENESTKYEESQQQQKTPIQ